MDSNRNKQKQTSLFHTHHPKSRLGCVGHSNHQTRKKLHKHIIPSGIRSVQASSNRRSHIRMFLHWWMNCNSQPGICSLRQQRTPCTHTHPQQIPSGVEDWQKLLQPEKHRQQIWRLNNWRKGLLGMLFGGMWIAVSACLPNSKNIPPNPLATPSQFHSPQATHEAFCGVRNDLRRLGWVTAHLS